MGIQRANVLYPVNTTTVDTGAGIDIRLLDSAQAAATDETQTATATHTQDNQQRTFDPATAGVTANVGAHVTAGKGYALRLSEDMTPDDDTNCNAYLLGGEPTVNLLVRLNQAGGTYSAGTYAPVWLAALWSWNPSTNVGTLLKWGTSNSASWNIAPIGGDLGTLKSVAIPLAVGGANPYEFPAGEIALLQIGVGMGTIPNPTLGTATWTYSLLVDDVNTNLTWGSGKGIRQACILSSNNVGNGTVARVVDVGLLRSATGKGALTESRVVVASKFFTLDGRGTVTRVMELELDESLIGVGAATESRAVIASKEFTLDGRGSVTRVFALALDLDVVGVGAVDAQKAVLATKEFTLDGCGVPTHSKLTQAAREFSLVGKGVVTRTLALAEDFDLVGLGIADAQKVVVASKSFTLDGRGTVTREGLILALLERDIVGAGVVTEQHPVQAYRTFSLVGAGIVTGTITIPIDEVPEEGGAPVVIRPIVLLVDD